MTIAKQDLEKDVLVSRYIDVPCIVILKTGECLSGPISSYTYDDEPFCNYAVIDGVEYRFDDIKEVLI